MYSLTVRLFSGRKHTNTVFDEEGGIFFHLVQFFFKISRIGKFFLFFIMGLQVDTRHLNFLKSFTISLIFYNKIILI